MAPRSLELHDPAALRQFAATLRGPVILPGDVAYEAARRVWNLAIDRRPAAIVRCASADDVARTIEFARSYQTPLAVRSGGHSQAGHGVCEGGIVIDLGSLRPITAEPERRVVRVGSGARVADVMKATQAHGLVTPMGGCPEVGVGGLTLGGGENFLMGTLGAVCDNVSAAEIVTADGRVLTASVDENSDLFWAIRGGGGNFGVATAFDYRLHPVDEVLSGQLVFDVAAAREVMLRYRDLMADVPDEVQTSGGLTMVDGAPGFFVAICYCGRRRHGDDVVSAWRAALRPKEDNVKWSAYSADLIVPAAASAGTGVFLPDLPDEVIEILAAAAAEAPPAASAVWNDFHGAVTRVPRDAMAFPLRDRGFDLFISVPWERDEERDEAAAWVSRLGAALRPFGRGVYINNLNEQELHRVPEAYGANYGRLAAIKAKYDPDNVFRVNQNIQPDGAG